MFYTITSDGKPRKFNGKRIIYGSVDEVQLGLQQLSNDFPKSKFSFRDVKKTKNDICVPFIGKLSGREYWA